MRTKKEIKKTLQCERSMNWVTDRFIVKAVEALNGYYCQCKSAYTYTVKELVDEAYEIEKASQNNQM